MKINGWDISEEKAKQWNVTFGNHAVNNSSDWVRGSPVPVLIRNTIGFKQIKIVLLVKDEGREKILQHCSNILSHLLGPADLELDRYEHRFRAILTKHSVDEKVLNPLVLDYNRASKLTLEFNAYEYGVQADGSPFSESASGSTQTVVTNPGNLVTPAIVEITPQSGIAELTVTGVCRNQDTGEDLPVIIKNLTTGKKIILDGETGLITEDGKLKECDIWELPTLTPGSNTITLSSNRMDITVKYYPRYM